MKKLTAKKSFFIALGIYLIGAILLIFLIQTSVTRLGEVFGFEEWSGALFASLLYWPFFTLIALIDPELSGMPLGIAGSVLFFLSVLFLIHAIKLRTSRLPVNNLSNK